ncbi:hypothetical protein CYMTET_53702 [Cymbomonas tetramitiformis]|uniref:Uncharacterized protein n=1 Tax=Cymbomonas tetramitiformis TaxID=36881 RepID=A0AAE0BI74_9CHLO|nr:hypothetical protein CYMTET_53702 [Cymbomonas tetramitiformis]
MEDAIPFEPAPDVEEIMKRDAIPAVTAPPTSPDQQLPAPEKTGLKFSEFEVLGDQRALSEMPFDMLSLFALVMPSSDCNEACLASDKAPLDRFSSEQSSIGMKHPYRVACVEPRLRTKLASSGVLDVVKAR